jgi:hypothetical protein
MQLSNRFFRNFPIRLPLRDGENPEIKFLSHKPCMILAIHEQRIAVRPGIEAVDAIDRRY